MRAVILAGGKGTRLMPYTAVLPKPLMPIGDRPILEILIEQLRNSGFTHLTIAVGHLAALIQTFFGDGSKWGVNVDYSLEDKPLGTAGPLGLIGNLKDDFLVINGDILTDLDFGVLMKNHKDSGACATVSTYKKKVEITLGVLEVENSHITNYIEKPTIDYEVSMGVYALSLHALKYIEKNSKLDFPDLFKTMISTGEDVRSFPFSGKWFDIGRTEDYELAVSAFKEEEGLYLP